MAVLRSILFACHIAFIGHSSPSPTPLIQGRKPSEHRVKRKGFEEWNSATSEETSFNLLRSTSSSSLGSFAFSFLAPPLTT
ncbi:hypothetical protein BDV38DRAFT_74513 [Aspergillus pseudotamarii]|uniref:Secreted protein n=1 Tax=Aspergillus pseudotamarii TaxID=132259 RepID=A0A5N6SU95_ASPPS|nr:uncharacterized protein BDV38DRAFT_74513 [Aspergillus pseudotamarii]KAE8138248.1 hypothetical protein BDV38DRAFT_74513 [Aspergillus pseudotamarii]